MTVAEMTNQEMRYTNPTIDQMVECCELLRATGWTWEVSSFTPPECKNAYNYGWWTKTGERGSTTPKEMLRAAWDTVQNYIAQ